MRVTDAAPISQRSDGNGASSSRSAARRSSGTAQISECTAALTSAHHAAAAALAAATLTGRPDRRLGQQRHHQIGLRVAAQVLHDALRLRIGGLAPIRAKPVMAGEPDIVGGGHHHVGDHPALQAAHPVGQHLGRDPADHRQRLGDHRQRRGGLLIGGEPHEPPPRERQHRAKHEQPRRGLGPVDHQILTRRPHRRAAATMMILAPQRFLLSDQPAEVPRRALIAGRPRDRQQPLGRDPAPRLGHPLGDQVPHRIEIARPRPRCGGSPPASARSTTRLTVLCVVPHNSAAPR